VDSDLLDALFTGRANLADKLEAHMGPPLPQVGANEPVSELLAVLKGRDAAVVLDDGKPRGVLTRQDVLGYLASSP